MKNIRLVIYDFDGVFTDNRVFVSEDGVESVSCNRSDGLWIAKIKDQKIPQMILSTETNPVVSQRAKKLGLEVLQGQSNKKQALLSIVEQKKLKLEEICYVGNDINDLECLLSVGFPLAPQDAHPDVLAVVKHTLPVKGGNGIVEHLFKWMNTTQPSKTVTSIGKGSAEAGETIRNIISKSIQVKKALLESPAILSLVEKMGMAAYEAVRDGKKVLFAGNGGSFADSMHLAAEFVSRLNFDRPALASIALGTSNSNLTAIGNDYGYEHVFEREILALGNPGDVFFAITTSGNSPNILSAVEAALKNGLIVYGWSGESGGKLANLCETFKVPASQTARIQEAHIMIGHAICEIVENQMFGTQKNKVTEKVVSLDSLKNHQS